MGYLYLKNLLSENMTDGWLSGNRFNPNALIINPLI